MNLRERKKEKREMKRDRLNDRMKMDQPNLTR